MELRQCPMRTPARVTSVDVGDVAMRARELGLYPGAPIRVTQRTVFGGMVIDVAGTRLAIDAAATKKIMVEVDQ